MNAKQIAGVSLLTVLALSPAYADKKKDPNQVVQAPPVTKQQGRQSTGNGGRQGGYSTQQTASGGKQHGQSRSNGQGSQGVNHSTARSVQGSERQSRSSERSGRNRTESRSSRSRGPSPDAVYSFHGRHRGGGRYVEGRLVGRYANDRVYVNDHWYIWQAPPLAFFGLGTYGWVADDGGGEYVESGPVGEIEPVIVGEYPGYYVVEVNGVNRRVYREDFYRRYPQYTRIHELRHGGHVDARSTGRGYVSGSRHNGPTANRLTNGGGNGRTARVNAPGGATVRAGSPPPQNQEKKLDKKNH